MVDLQNGARPQAGDGTPQNASSQPGSEQPGEGEQQGQSGQKYLTEADVIVLFNRLRDGIADSISARTANRVKRVIETAAQSGVQMTAIQAKSLIEEMDVQAVADRQAQAHPQNAQAAQPGAPGQEDQPEEPDPVLLTAMAMIEEAGITIDENDPELALIDQKTTDRRVFLDSVDDAIKAKRERLAQRLPARMPNLSSGGKGQGGSKAALTAELQRLLNEPGTKDWTRIREVKAQLGQYNT